MKLYLILILITLISCQNAQDTNVSTNSTNIPAQIIKEVNTENNTPKLVNFFSDNKNIGKKSFGKIEISEYDTGDDFYVVVKFFSKKNGDWNLKNEYKFEKSINTEFNAELKDFNNDGFKDFTYKSLLAARGANEVRRLFIYDKRKDELVYIENSENYPNMQYNKELDCIDTFLVYGGCSTVFLKLKGNKLVEFASVELFDGLTVTTFDKNGKKKIILEDKKNKSEMIRYKNFRPLKGNKNY
jgi:hypothetical protein